MIADFLIKIVDFPQLCNKLPEGITGPTDIGWLASGGLLQPKLPASSLEETQEGPRSERSADLVGGDWNMTSIFPYVGNNNSN